ncbi:hypothetical protein C4K88_10000 [Arthrobacter pityocampae]|uniref:Uncharacterized protein n=1 Tax=Arthrobacter pityocampae TaxID=547334 RepID=A0A2S5IWY4_9MICC|nr:hypothetical protein [Arthrobacter pityocampae]PPB49044.1 hypothetical protein C4K88_10000 [Arthrobacter pityocampae]
MTTPTPSTPYVANKPKDVPSAEALRARIPGWGVDLDPKDRPSYPREVFDPAGTGAHWDYPEEQPGREGRERSIEHGQLTPVFGTSAPLHGVSGSIRRYAYRYSEGRAAHWLLLLAGDRVDAWGAHLWSLASLRPDNPVTQTGVLSEVRRQGITSRFGKKRADVNHLWLDPVVVAGPWVAAAAGAVVVVRAAVRRAR